MKNHHRTLVVDAPSPSEITVRYQRYTGEDLGIGNEKRHSHERYTCQASSAGADACGAASRPCAPGTANPIPGAA